MRTRLASTTVAALLAATGAAHAQVQQTQIERFDRQLEGIRRDTRLQINPQIPATERMYFDYGGYMSFSYLSLDSPSSATTTTTTNPDGSTNSTTTPAGIHNTGMRQYEVGFYSDLIFDGANEVFFRGRLFHRDFNPGDRFNSDGEDVDGRIDRLFYRFDLAKFQAAYQGSQAKVRCLGQARPRSGAVGKWPDAQHGHGRRRGRSQLRSVHAPVHWRRHAAGYGRL